MRIQVQVYVNDVRDFGERTELVCDQVRRPSDANGPGQVGIVVERDEAKQVSKGDRFMLTLDKLP